MHDSDFSSILHDRSRTQTRHTDTAMYSEADELSMSESVEMSDSDDIYTFTHTEPDSGGAARDIGGHVDAPPSYHEATASAPPLETSLDNSLRSALPPSYDDFLTNQSRYAKSS